MVTTDSESWTTTQLITPARPLLAAFATMSNDGSAGVILNEVVGFGLQTRHGSAPQVVPVIVSEQGLIRAEHEARTLIPAGLSQGNLSRAIVQGLPIQPQRNSHRTIEVRSMDCDFKFYLLADGTITHREQHE